MMDYNVLHVSTVHRSDDVRIFQKMCISSSRAGFRTAYIVPCESHKSIDGVDIIALPKRKNRLGRILNLWLVLCKVLKIKADVYHFHDPELLLVAPFLKLRNGRVIYDAHENLPKQILTKYWIPKALRTPISFFSGILEQVLASFCEFMVAATPNIASRFPAKKTVVIQNFPVVEEFEHCEKHMATKRGPVLYMGGINANRGVIELINAMYLIPEELGIRLRLVGSFRTPELEKRARALPGWSRVDFLGWQDRKCLRIELAKARLGIVTFLRAPNHVEAQPNKLFEYMSAGLPVIASDFPLWRQLIEKVGCGRLVDPADPHEIARVIQDLIAEPQVIELMGRNGKKAIAKKYNWRVESQKLFQLYGKILNENPYRGRGAPSVHQSSGSQSQDSGDS